MTMQRTGSPTERPTQRAGGPRGRSTTLAATVLVALLAALLAAPTVGAQSWRDEPETGAEQARPGSDAWERREARRQPGAPFGEDIRGYEYEGFYAQFGVSVGEIEFDGGPDVDAGGGFTMTGGYRFFPWLAAEGNLSYLGGGDVRVGGRERDADFFAFTVGPKFFPLGLLDDDDQPFPEIVQPYALIGLGGGEYDIEDTAAEEGTFIARFILGFDVWITDQMGAFVEGGYHVASDDDIDGTGLFTVGGQYRF